MASLFIGHAAQKSKLHNLQYDEGGNHMAETETETERVITVFTVFRLLTDFVCLYNYEFGLSLCKIVRSWVILLLPLFIIL